jgi:hypothetical protein
MRTILGGSLWILLLPSFLLGAGIETTPRIELKQVTFGPKHHFFGYIGHVGTIPWNASGQDIVALRVDFQDHMPGPEEAAEIVLIDTQKAYGAVGVDETRAWNPQQGTMLYWNPESPETQFFFNDRDPETNKVFCVLFDRSAGSHGERVREYRFDDTPIGNSGIAQNGGFFLGLNYGRLARLRPVTGYPGAYDWTEGVNHPVDDGIFKVSVVTGEKVLLVSYRQLAEALRTAHPGVDEKALFINHTLWNRDGDRIYFFVRGDFETERRLDVPFTINPDGTGLTMHRHHIGGHPEWADGNRMIGRRGRDTIVYDTDSQTIVEVLGDPTVFPKPGGDIALSADGTRLVAGYREGKRNNYVVFRLSDGSFAHTGGIDIDNWTVGPLRLDPSPCWNRDGTQILFPGIADDSERTRQLFLLHVAVEAER